jgi:hypothetical protein
MARVGFVGRVAAISLLVVVAIGVWYMLAMRESTECFARFDSESEADAAIAEALAARIDVEIGPHNQRDLVTFSSGETAEDARRFEADTFSIVESHDGKLSHPGGCTISSGLGD